MEHLRYKFVPQEDDRQVDPGKLWGHTRQAGSTTSSGQSPGRRADTAGHRGHHARTWGTTGLHRSCFVFVFNFRYLPKRKRQHKSHKNPDFNFHLKTQRFLGPCPTRLLLTAEDSFPHLLKLTTGAPPVPSPAWAQPRAAASSPRADVKPWCVGFPRTARSASWRSLFQLLMN